MSILLQQPGALTTDPFIVNVASAEFDLFTAGHNLPILTNILLINTTGSAVTILLEYNDGSNDYQLDETVSIAANGRLDRDFNIAMRQGDVVKITAGTADALHGFISRLEGGGST